MTEPDQQDSEQAYAPPGLSATSSSDDDGLVSRLRLIEDQPLETRATAYAQLHDQLQARLEGGDAPRAHA